MWSGKFDKRFASGKNELLPKRQASIWWLFRKCKTQVLCSTRTMQGKWTYTMPTIVFLSQSRCYVKNTKCFLFTFIYKISLWLGGGMADTLVLETSSERSEGPSPSWATSLYVTSNEPWQGRNCNFHAVGSQWTGPWSQKPYGKAGSAHRPDYELPLISRGANIQRQQPIGSAATLIQWYVLVQLQPFGLK